MHTLQRIRTRVLTEDAGDRGTELDDIVDEENEPSAQGGVFIASYCRSLKKYLSNTVQHR